MYSGIERTRTLIKVLNKYNIKAAFYSNPSKFDKDDGAKRMRLYNDAGHFIGNHTFSHPSFNKIATKDFISNIERADGLLKEFTNFKAWFRYPFLHHGNTKEKRDGVRRYLKNIKYSHGFVTVDNQDWFMASLVDTQLKNGGKINEKNLCWAYAEMLWDSIKYFDEIALKYLKRSPSHVLLLHENDLAALCIEKLISKIQSMGWDIVSPESAMSDEIYSKVPNTFYNNNGQVAALTHELSGYEASDPWSTPWDNGKKIEDEFKERGVFQ